MYDKLKTTDGKGNKLKCYHHISIGKRFKDDCRTWLYFLENSHHTAMCRPFVDFENSRRAVALNFATDAMLNPNLGMGGIFQNFWFFSNGTRSSLSMKNQALHI